MKKVRMIQLIVIIICALGYFFAHAQSDYLVLTKGDTLYGKVKHLSYGTEQNVQLEQSGEKRKKIFPMLQVKAFQLENEHYHLIRTTSRYTYMKLIKAGYLSLYAFQMEGQNIWNGRYLYKLDGDGIEVPTLGFKKKMNDFLSSCSDLTSAIEAGNLNRNDLDEIIDRYNACVDGNTEIKTKEAEVVNKNSVAADQWSALESKIRETSIADKNTILEMIAEAKSKSSQGEKIPNFLKDALKRALQEDATLNELLTKALEQEGQ